MGKTRHDWLSIQSEYTNAVPAISQADLCKKYGINPVTMCRKAKKENWEFQRDRFQTRLSEQKSENKAVAVASEGKAWDDRCLAMAKKLMDLADEEVAGHPAKDRQGNVIVDADGKPWLFKSYAKDVATAIKTAQEIGKAALGDKADGGSLDLLVLEIKKAIE
jgi:hypothetical protein